MRWPPDAAGAAAPPAAVAAVAAVEAVEAEGAHFAGYARYYDLLYRDKDYAGEAAYIAGLIGGRLPAGPCRILELGCGSGGHAEQLARLGHSVHGVDISDGMLEAAQARRAALPAELAARLRFSRGDVRSVRLDGGGSGPFDAVISLFHVMSYQTRNADLRAAYDTAAAHLRPGGLFLYDYWYGPAVLAQQPAVRVRRLADAHSRITRIAEPVLHTARNVCDVNFTLFIEAVDSGAIGQLTETHPMRYLFVPELDLFEADRWCDAQNRAWLSDLPPDAGTWAALRSTVRR